MSVFVKICGLCSAEDVAAVAQLRPDAMGFVFWSRSPRCVRPEEVGEWAANLPSGIRKVGVFVDADVGEIARTVETAGLDTVQLHGFQSMENRQSFFPMIGKSLRAAGFQVWRVAHVGRNEEIALQRAGDYDVVVIDSYTKDMPGGTGRCCDWDAARRFVEQCSKPVLLAGGLTADNVRDAIARVRPWGVDVSSGVEQRTRVKDLRKVERFISECRK